MTRDEPPDILWDNMTEELEKTSEIQLGNQAQELFNDVVNKLRTNEGLRTALTDSFLDRPGSVRRSIDFESGRKRYSLRVSRHPDSDRISISSLSGIKSEGVELWLRYKEDYVGCGLFGGERGKLEGVTIGHHIIDPRKDGDDTLDQVINNQEAIERIKDFIDRI